MKSLLLLIALLVFSQLSYSQATIAKLKYEQAEEAFSKGDYYTTLVKLDEAENILGAVNPRLMYLRILSQDKLLSSDKTLVKALVKNCAYYLKEYEGNPSLEDKYKEVYLISEKLEQFKENDDFIAGEKHYKEKNYSEAMKSFQKAAAQGYARAYSFIGILHEYGLGVPKDYNAAFKNYKIAASKGSGRAKYFLGRCYYHGMGVERNDNEALALFIASAEESPEQPMRTEAMEGAADVYYYKMKNGAQALEWYRKGAENGNVSCMGSTGWFYLFGSNGAPRDPAKALGWFQKGAEKGNLQSIGNLGYMYLYGKAVSEDYVKALEYFKAGAEKGSAYCCRMIGWMYYDRTHDFTGDKKQKLKELGIDKDADKALEWFTKAAEKGDEHAMYYIGCLYYPKFYAAAGAPGFGNSASLKNDEDKALEWFLKAAEKGHVNAMLQLANYYNIQGSCTGLSKNKEKCAEEQKWKDKAVAAKANQ